MLCFVKHHICPTLLGQHLTCLLCQYDHVSIIWQYTSCSMILLCKPHSCPTLPGQHLVFCVSMTMFQNTLCSMKHICPTLLGQHLIFYIIITMFLICDAIFLALWYIVQLSLGTPFPLQSDSPITIGIAFKRKVTVFHYIKAKHQPIFEYYLHK